VKITADTNVLARAVVGDDARQSKRARDELARTEIIALAIPALCELVRVLSRGYKIASAQIAEAIERLVDSNNVVVDRPAVEAGLAMLRTGGDFADGAIAYEGRWLGADSFVSFDKLAVKLFSAQGESARLLTG
jgi:predicted nucleic-acid-binding protein